MIRVLLYFILLAALAYGGMLLVENPGHIQINWLGYDVNAPAALLLGIVAFVSIVAWGVARFIFNVPSAVGVFARQRKREKGYAALSRGLIAVHAGDGRGADRAAAQAVRHLPDDPLALMLRAQSAELAGDTGAARAAFEELSQRSDTRLLGLRGLHAEAMARGDEEAARHFATIAHRTASLPWSARAVLEHRAADGDWEQALRTVEHAVAAKLVDRETGERQRAVLETAIALQKEATAPDAALALARAAMRRAPDLAPPVALATRLLARKGDIRKAARLAERAWPRCQHPEIARAYMDVRPGDSTSDRLARARTLMGIATFDPVSRLTVARAAMANTDFAAARAAMAPLIAEGQRPTVRMCLLMAELEEAEHGDVGLWREWLARAARAPLDPAWVADGIVYERWEPTSPTTGRLDAFRWQVPAERFGPAMEAMPAPRPRPDGLIAREAAVTVPHADGVALPAPEAAAEPEAPAPAPWSGEGAALAAAPSGALFHRHVADGAGSATPAEESAAEPESVEPHAGTAPLAFEPTPSPAPERPSKTA